MWSDALVAKARKKLGAALLALNRCGDDLMRTWQEVEVEVEAETGENKLEKLAVCVSISRHRLHARDPGPYLGP